jgi:hypothetical protein
MSGVSAGETQVQVDLALDPTAERIHRAQSGRLRAQHQRDQVQMQRLRAHRGLSTGRGTVVPVLYSLLSLFLEIISLLAEKGLLDK